MKMRGVALITPGHSVKLDNKVETKSMSMRRGEASNSSAETDDPGEKNPGVT